MYGRDQIFKYKIRIR